MVIGTKNPAKITEWKNFLSGVVEMLDLSFFGDLPDVVETGATFSENARLKAEYYARIIGEYVLSEDGGLEIDALNGAPGVKSRRILPGDKDGTDQQLINFILENLKGVPREERTARLVVNVVVINPWGQIVFEDVGRIEGIVPEKAAKSFQEGYPFRAVFFIPQAGKCYSELTPEEHEKFSHRAPIVKRLIRFLEEFEKD